MIAPFVLSITLIFSGRPSGAVRGTDYWLSNLVSDPNASYLSEPGGSIYLAISLAMGILVFLLLPLALWRRLNRNVPVALRDRAAVDSSFTLVLLLLMVWIYRAFTGYSDLISTVASAMILLSIYVPVFSALLALMMPVIPGSGRIGGILPGFLRVPFTKRFLFSPPERAEVTAFTKQLAEDAATDES